MEDGRWRMAGQGAPRLRAVLLDCLGTMLKLDSPGPRLRRGLGARGIEVSARAADAALRAEIAYYLEHHLEGSDPAGLRRLRTACARVMADRLGLGRDLLPAVREAMLEALRFEPYPDAPPALADLREAGLRLVVVSNWDCSLGRTLADAGVRPLVDAVVTSAEAGAAKPDPAVFGAALRVAGCEAERAVCVGDSLEKDVAGARAAGVDAILLAREGRAAGGYAAVVGSLGEARSLILAGQ